MRWLALAVLLGCSMSKSAERQDSFGQEVESRRDEGAVRVVETVEEFAVAAPHAAEQDPVALGRAVLPPTPPDYTNGPARQSGQPQVIRRTVTITDRAPVVVSTKTQTDASGEAHTASASRFGFSPWQWAIGLAVAAALAYGAFWVKRRLAI